MIDEYQKLSGKDIQKFDSKSSFTLSSSTNSKSSNTKVQDKTKGFKGNGSIQKKTSTVKTGAKSASNSNGSIQKKKCNRQNRR